MLRYGMDNHQTNTDRLELLSAESREGSIEFMVRGTPDSLSTHIGAAIAAQNHERDIEHLLLKAFNNGGHIEYEVFWGPSGPTVECNRTDGAIYGVKIHYNQKNSISRRNTLNLVQSMYQRMVYDTLPEPIRRVEESLGYMGQR
jgi:hypothetical protein